MDIHTNLRCKWNSIVVQFLIKTKLYFRFRKFPFSISARNSTAIRYSTNKSPERISVNAVFELLQNFSLFLTLQNKEVDSRVRDKFCSTCVATTRRGSDYRNRIPSCCNGCNSCNWTEFASKTWSIYLYFSVLKKVRW